VSSFREPPADPTVDDKIAELERRVHDLEARAHASPAERDELAAACRDVRASVRAAEDAVRVRDEILAIVAHDLRNPLGTIVMGATALEQFGASSDASAQRIRGIAERIQRQAARMTRQLGNLTDFVEIQAGRLTIERAAHSPSAIIAATSELIGPIARERGIALEARTAADLPVLECDAERAVQALSSLCGNAVKVSSSGGLIELGARSGSRSSVELFVRDHGPGIERDELTAMFDPSWRSKHPGYKAAGLGFAIARGIVAAHGGRIWADSAPGSGTTVAFSLTPEG
jgi:signal transduction histidine kinase